MSKTEKLSDLDMEVIEKMARLWVNHFGDAVGFDFSICMIRERIEELEDTFKVQEGDE